MEEATGWWFGQLRRDLRRDSRPTNEIDEERRDRDERGEGERTRARQRRWQIEQDRRQRQQHDVANQLEEPLEGNRGEDGGAGQMRGACDEDDARRLATVGDEHVVEAEPRERRSKRQSK